MSVEIGAEPEVAIAHAVTGNYFSVLGVLPKLGRVIKFDDESPRFHKQACIIGGGIWVLLPLFEPSMRSVPYAAACLVLLALTLFRGLTDVIAAKLLRARHPPF